MGIQLHAGVRRRLTAAYRWLREQPRRMAALISAMAVLMLSIGLVLTNLPEPEEDKPSLPSAPVVQEEEIQHAAGTLDAKLAALKKLAIPDADIDATLQKGMGYRNEAAPFAVFFSVSDGQTRATVVAGTGDTLLTAWNTAAAALRTYAGGQNGGVNWIKADVVDHMESIATADLPSRLADCRENGFRQGIAFDDEFEQVLLEAELNAAGAIDYDADTLNLPNANIYLANADRDGISILPSTLLLFTTKGYFCDETDTAYALSTDQVYYGQRTEDTVDKERALDLLDTNAQYLIDSLQENGQFRYCYLPAADQRLTGYNMMRHAEAVWSLCQQQQLTGDTALRLTVDQAIAYLQTRIKTQDEKAFVYEESDGEIRLGGNAMALVALVEYADAFDSDQYDDLITQLANGILHLQDAETGGFTHVLNTDDLTVKTESYSGYYDGQATFALAKAYGYTKDERLLTAAKAAADRMIAEDYEERGDQWVAYAMNELTKHAPEEVYFALGLDTAQENLPTIRNRIASAPYGLELLMATFEMVERMEEQSLFPQRLTAFDKEGLTQAIDQRVQRTLNGYFYPETAMYMASPARVLGVFYTREDRFRVRLDDIQQAISGYTAFVRHYDALHPTVASADEG